MEDTAFLFAFAQFYTRWLLGPALLGLAVFLYSMVRACVRVCEREEERRE